MAHLLHRMTSVKPELKKALGPLVALHRYPSIRWKDAILWSALGLLGVLIPLFYGLSRFQYGYTKFGVSAAHQWSRPWYLLAILALFTYCLLLYTRLRWVNRFAAVHQNGLNIKLSQEGFYRWEQLAGISTSVEQPQFLSLPLRPRFHAILYPNLGKPIHLNESLQEFPELLTQIKARLYPHLIPNLKASFEAGQWAYFGAVAINQRVLSINKKSHPWSDVKRLTIERGLLVVELENQAHLRLPVSRIPNLEILLQLIHIGVTA